MKRINSQRRLVTAAMAALALQFGAGLAPANAQAAEYPQKAIQLVVPFAPGGITDLLGRLLAERMETLYPQPIVVENRPGASGHIGASLVAKAQDPHMLLVGTIGIHAAYSAYSKLPYDPAAELQPIMILSESPNVVLVPVNSPFKTFEELLAFQKANPGKLNYATAGPGSSTHMVIALFEQQIGTQITYVPYKGSGPALIDLIGGQVDVMFDNLPTGLPHVQGGKLRALAVTSPQRDPLLPDVPTVAESGVPGYAGQSWFTLAAGNTVDPAIVDKLSADVREALQSDEMKQRFSKLGMTIVASTPQQARERFDSETRKWSEVIRQSGIKLD